MSNSRFLRFLGVHVGPVLALLGMSVMAPPAWATMPTRTGDLPAPVLEAFQAGLFALPEHALPTGTSAVQAEWNIPVIMVGFSDAPLVISAAEMQTALFDTTGANPNGSVSEYYRWVSGNRLRVTGKIVAVVNLPSTRGFYAYNFYGLSRESTPQNLYGLARDALLTCDGTVDWSPYDVNHDGFVDALWVIHQGIAGETSVDRSNLWSITSRMSGGWSFGGSFSSSQRIPGTTNQFYKVDRFSTCPELSTIIPGRRAEIGTFCHEFGHALGLPDLYDTSGIPAGVVNVGPGNWSLMSTGAYGGSGLTPERPSHIGAWCQRFLGWTQTVRPTQDTLITLRPIARGDPPIEVWFQGRENPEHFIIENRQRESFDLGLPSGGLVITHVDEGVISQRLAGNHVNVGMTPGLVMLEGDGDGDLMAGRNRGDSSDPLPGALGITGVSDEGLPNFKSFRGGYSNLALGDIETIGSDIRFRLQVRAPGWGPVEPIGAGAGISYDSRRPARWARTDSERRVYMVKTEWTGSSPQIVLYSRLGNTWLPGEQISHSPVGAFDPALAVLPGGDLAVVWTDSRGGRSRIFLRTRIRGVWQPEVAISLIDGDSHHASIGADQQGTIHVAWANDQLGVRRLYFKRFAYFAPFGMSSPFTDPSENPDPPALEVRPNGASYLVWADHATTPTRLYYSRFHPDSGMSARAALTPTPAAAQLDVSLAVDPGGDLHIVWQVAGSGVSELHYQRRRQALGPSPRDTTLESSGYFKNPWVACDDSGGVHVGYENWSKQIPVPSYRLWTPWRGWDMGGTELWTEDSGGSSPAVLPHGPGDVTTVFVRQVGTDLQWSERRRRYGVSTTVSVDPGPAPVEVAAFRVSPNPVRAGSAVRLFAAGDGAAFEIFDLVGRRVAAIPAEPMGAWREATIPATLTSRWAGGVYFARLRGAPGAQRFVVLN